MNRAERRSTGKDIKEKVYTLRASDIQTIKYNATAKAVEKAFFLMLAIPTMILHDKYGLLMKKEKDGKSREERFVELCEDLYDTYEKGYVTIEELQKCLFEEAGVKIQVQDEDGRDIK